MASGPAGRGALSLSPAGLERVHHFRDSRGARLRTLRALDPPNEILAVERRKRLEEGLGFRFAVQSGGHVRRNRFGPRTFGTKNDVDGGARVDGVVAAPGRTERQKKLRSVGDEHAADLVPGN